MRLRTVFFVSMFGLLLGVIALFAVGVIFIVSRQADSDVHAGLQRGKQAFEELQTLRQALIRSQVRVVAEEPRLKAVAATKEIDHETVLGVAQELRLAVQTDMFIITDRSGRLLVDVADPEAKDFDMSQNSLVADALTKGLSFGVLADGNDVYEVQGRRLQFGNTTVGVLLLGFRLDDKKAEAAAENSGATTVVALDDKLIASSNLENGKSIEKAQMSQTLAAAFANPEVTLAMRYLGTEYAVVAHAYPNFQGQGKLQYAVMRSQDAALAPSRTLRKLLLGLLFVGGLIVGLLAIVLARRISQPIDDLVAFTKRVNEGDLEQRATLRGSKEVIKLGAAINAMLQELGEGRDAQAKQLRLEEEMHIAARIQTALLPRELAAPNADISAIMKPATEVGGDYYDFLPLQDGAWIGIGDVAGHTLASGLIMLMVKSVVTAITRLDPDLTPKDVLCMLNRIVFDSVRNRLRQDEHATLCLLHYDEDGTFVFAGAHEDIIVWRASTGKCELLPTPGTWVGSMPEIDRFTVNSVCLLAPGDMMVLYTDGVTEAMNAEQEQFGIQRLVQTVETHSAKSALGVRDAILEQLGRWWTLQSDDVSVVVIRYKS